MLERARADSCGGWGAGSVERKPRVEPVEEGGEEWGAVTVPCRGDWPIWGFYLVWEDLAYVRVPDVLQSWVWLQDSASQVYTTTTTTITISTAAAAAAAVLYHIHK